MKNVFLFLDEENEENNRVCKALDKNGWDYCKIYICENKDICLKYDIRNVPALVIEDMDVLKFTGVEAIEAFVDLQ